MADFKLKVSKFLYISGSIGRLEFPLRMVLRRFLRILPISTHFHVIIFIVVEIKLKKCKNITNKTNNTHRLKTKIQ